VKLLLDVYRCRMGLSGSLHFMLLILTSVSVILPAPNHAYESLSVHTSSFPGQFNHSYELNVSRATPISILYNQSHDRVIIYYYYRCRFFILIH